jgi:hypothetical protein
MEEQVGGVKFYCHKNYPTMDLRYRGIFPTFIGTEGDSLKIFSLFV